MVFLTQYSSRGRRFPSCVGSGIKVLYAPVFDRDGVMHLEQAGTEDLYASIQSHKDSCDIYVILGRYQAGDVSALSKVQGLYGDFTQVPKTFAEALNVMIAAESYFDSLPVEEKAKYNNSFHQYLANMDKINLHKSQQGQET